MYLICVIVFDLITKKVTFFIRYNQDKQRKNEIFEKLWMKLIS